MEIDAYVRVLAEAVSAPESLVRMAMRDNPAGYQEFLERLSELAAISTQLNNTNIIEQAIMHNLPASDIPATLPTPGVRRSANEDTEASDE